MRVIVSSSPTNIKLWQMACASIVNRMFRRSKMNPWTFFLPILTYLVADLIKNGLIYIGRSGSRKSPVIGQWIHAHIVACVLFIATFAMFTCFLTLTLGWYMVMGRR